MLGIYVLLGREKLLPCFFQIVVKNWAFDQVKICEIESIGLRRIVIPRSFADKSRTMMVEGEATKEMRLDLSEGGRKRERERMFDDG